MIGRTTIQIDNRDSGQMYEYLEARIDVLKSRVAELEMENRRLRHNLGRAPGCGVTDYVGHAHEMGTVLTQRVAS